MPNNTREIKRRIKSVKNTKKITKAMELVSAAKMRKAVGRVLATRSYAHLAWETLHRIAGRLDVSLSPLLEKRSPIKKIGVVVITSNRGLCGGFNSNVINKALRFLKNRRDEDNSPNIDVITLGKKAFGGLVKHSFTMSADFIKKDVTTDVIDILPLSGLLIKEYVTGVYDEVFVVYTDFHSALRQVPRAMRLLPFSLTDIDAELGTVDESNDSTVEHLLEIDEYLIEPDPKKLFEAIAPKIIEIKIYQAVLESEASEHSSRMMAMKNASEAASDMIQELTFVYNQARQAGITREISEIAAGKASLE